MKRLLCLVLASVLLLCCAACGGEPVSSVDGSVDISSTTTTTQSPPPVAPYTDKWNDAWGGSVILKPNGTTPAIVAGNIGIPDATGVPHNDKTAADLTDCDAQAILEILIPRQFEVFSLFNLDHDKVDYTQNAPFSKWYSPYSDDRFSCVQDIRDFILQVYTGEEAKQLISTFDWEGLPEESDTYPYYRDYNGKLYRCTYAEGKGLNYSYYLTATTTIIERGEDVVLVKMYGDSLNDEDDEKDMIYLFLLCKTPDGWRLDSRILLDVLL